MDELMFVFKWILMIPVILLMIPVIWGLMFISIFVHEMGHLLMYLLFYRENKWRIEIGAKGKKLFEIGRFTIYLNMLTGHIYYDYKKDNKLNSIMTSAGGPLATLLLIIFILGYIFKANPDKNGLLYWNLCFMFYHNLSLFITAIIPINTKNYTSDGWRIIDNLKGDYE